MKLPKNRRGKMKLPKKITYIWLRKHDACDGGVDRFKKLFPNGVIVSLESIRKLTKTQRKFVNDYFGWFSDQFNTVHDYDDEAKCFCKQHVMRKKFEGMGYKL